MIYKGIPKIPDDKYYNSRTKIIAYKIVNIPAWNTLIYVIIVANTIILAMD